MFLSTLQFTLLCIYNFVFLVMVELLSDTNAYVRWKPLKIAWKTDSRTKTGQSWCKAEWKERKTKKSKGQSLWWCKGPCSWVCKVSSVSSERECVLVDACLHGFPLAVLHSNQAERKSVSTCRQHICRGLKIHPVSHMVQTRLSEPIWHVHVNTEL